MYIIEDVPVASQLSTLKVEVLDASHCPLLGRVQGRIVAKYMGKDREVKSCTGHFWLPSLKVHHLTSAALRGTDFPQFAARSCHGSRHWCTLARGCT